MRGLSLCWQVRQILYSDEADDVSQLQQQQPTCFIEHSLFVQLDVLCHFDDDDSIGWKEMARYEQCYFSYGFSVSMSISVSYFA